ncbi:hypothetical protein Poli38472_000571 [Pythium oligandrum]|uniref:phosphomevalonate kinase n=1 Tax=Pythium oligandrum TaxID=41045 RepID=A0A8K1CCJ4_PYTOL|nr:hypothetical protein Poli38472_000571 [Pythium oligandrum]|eukprot:TMW60529.1 hypothetical protein Poli38472_000571 [Pythium oligandrum]
MRNDELTWRRGVRVSAPGKVLLTGAYLILDERHAGLVVGTSARFHATLTTRKAATTTNTTHGFSVCVESPQFAQRIEARVFRKENATQYTVELSEGSDRNAYVEETLLSAVNGIAGMDHETFERACQELHGQHEELHIRLEADNAFYSQAKRLITAGKSLSRRHLEELSEFLPPLMEDLPDGRKTIAKTGLGSSATLVTSLVGALAAFFLGETSRFSSHSDAVDLIHNLAQLSHCFVQRKIGSGFDVAAACYGSQRYSRFSPLVLDRFTSTDHLTPDTIARCVLNPTTWRVAERTKPFVLPANFHLLMGDVSTGSTTVSMVRQVLQWQKTKPEEAQRIIQTLASQNEAVAEAVARLGSISTSEMAQACKQLSTVAADQWSDVNTTIGPMLYDIRTAYQLARRSFREMGELAGVPIEPSEQTQLIDATLAVPGVLIAGVPGAGGYDAVFVLVVDASALVRVEALWLQWTQQHPDNILCPLLCDLSVASGLTIEVV